MSAEDRKPPAERGMDDQTLSELDHSVTDGDQTAADLDQSAADRDAAASEQDQLAPDRDAPLAGGLMEPQRPGLGSEMLRPSRGERR
jgi:hypothetical protein